MMRDVRVEPGHPIITTPRYTNPQISSWRASAALLALQRGCHTGAILRAFAAPAAFVGQMLILLR